MNNHHFPSRLFWGGILIFVGVVLLADNFFFPGSIWPLIARLWPLFLIVLGVWLLVKPGRSILGGGILLFIGAIFLLSGLGLPNFRIWNLWPLFLVFIGITILFRPTFMGKAVSEENLSEVVLFGAIKRKISSKSFRSGNITTIFGESDIDLSDTSLKDKIVIDITVMFGGAKLKLPKNVRLVNEAVAI